MTILAKGVVLCAFSYLSDMRMIEHAPSLILLAFAPVTVPSFLNEGLNLETTSSLYLLTSSSLLMVFSPPLFLILIGVISDAIVPFLLASMCLAKVILQY